MLSDLIDAYESRLQSYYFLQNKLEQELLFTHDPAFVQFCECETKRLMDLIQLCEQVLSDLNSLTLDGRPIVESVIESVVKPKPDDIKKAEGE